MGKENYRIYKLESKEDFIIYLWSLIVSVDRHLVQYKKYLDQLEALIKENNIIDKPGIKVPKDYYEEMNDKIQKRSGHLLNLIGDYTIEGLSYKRFRNIVASNKKRGIDYGLPELDLEITKAITDFHNSRNWGMHEPASLLNAQLEEIREQTGEDPKSYLLSRIVPEISWHDFTNYEGYWLIDLFTESQHIYGGFRMVHQQMKKDYSILIGERVRIRRIKTEVRPFQSEFTLPKTSMAMQTQVYKKEIESEE
ncbi:hypothetical protein CIG75_09515 [Tumebacillus algifaecis]|uniref:Uncharacterized protein n=1 Tax=Tumebacillus algifaecis TaxID=1214604 RepID=A0A223D1J6_9BACL|nr:hypothetical protein [Tumebacillus algifaecis]ASS75196.1 hypothetical protein CIG75_09515 [Tumebacillus algifaecis]